MNEDGKKGDNSAAVGGADTSVPKILPMVGSSGRAVSRREAGVLLGVSWKTIERLVNRGELRAFKVLGQWRIQVAEIDAYVRRQTDDHARRIGA